MLTTQQNTTISRLCCVASSTKITIYEQQYQQQYIEGTINVSFIQFSIFFQLYYP